MSYRNSGMHKRPIYGDRLSIDRGHCLSSGLVGYFVFNEPVKNVINIAQPHQVWNHVGNGTQAQYDIGTVYDYGSGTTGYIQNSVVGSLALTSPFSIFTIATARATGSWCSIIGAGNGANNFYINVSSSSALQINMDIGGSGVCTSTGTSHSYGAWNSYAVGVDSVSSSCYQGGLDYTGTGSGSAGGITLNRIGGGSSEVWPGQIALISAWSRRLSPAEFMQMHLDPYGVVRVNRSKACYVFTAAPEFTWQQLVPTGEVPAAFRQQTEMIPY